MYDDDDEHVSETDDGNDENAFAVALRTPARTSRDTPLRDITDQFFHPPSPSPRRPHKPKSRAYPANPPNWLSSLPPSSPFPPSPTSDPFGFVAVERVLKARRTTAVKSPPRSTVLPPRPSIFASLSQPVPTNNEDIEGLYTDEPVAGPSHAHVPVAPLLLMHSDQPLAEIHSQHTSPDPLRTPRKRKRRASPTPDGDPDPDDDGTDVPSSPSPVKLPVLTRAQTRARAKLPKRVKTSSRRIPTPSSTPASAPSTPVPPRRSTRQAAVGARVKCKDTSTTSDEGRMKLRPRSTKPGAETKTRAKQPPAKSKASTRTQNARPTRGRPKGKSGAKDKGKTRPLESVLDLSDDTREKYEKERRERVEYFKRLEGYQIQKENVYVV